MNSFFRLCLKATLFIVVAGLFSFLVAAENGDYQVSHEDELVVLRDGQFMDVAVAPARGGELSGLKVRVNGQWHELLYRGRDYSKQPGWRGKAPLLWPATGASVTPDGVKNQYQLRDKVYPMPFHGFARSIPWKILKSDYSSRYASVTLGISDNDDTKKYYPFGFNLSVEYRLQPNRLSLIYRLTADQQNTWAMPFSMGNHITFNAPLIPGTAAGDLEFSSELGKRLLINDQRVFTDKTEASPYQGRYRLDQLPRRQAVSLGEGRAELSVYDPSGLQLTVAHHSTIPATAPAVLFNLWADTVEGFFSPEPWQGTQNSLNSQYGLILLKPGQHWQWKIDLTLVFPENTLETL